MSQLHIKYLPAAELVVHPQATLPPLAEAEFAALLARSREAGTLHQPLKVSKQRVIGQTAGLTVARQLGFELVPTIEVSEEQIISDVVFTLLLREHYTKGQRAYIIYPLLEPLIEESRERRAANLMKGGHRPALVPDSALSALSEKRVDSPDSALSALSEKRVFMPVYQFTGTVEDAAEKLGISRRLLFQARDIHKLFSDPEKGARLRAKFEPEILASDDNGAVKGLGALVAGITSSADSKGGTVERHDPALAWDNRISRMFPDNRFVGWHLLAPEVKAVTAKKFADELMLKAPAEIIETIGATLAERNSPVKLKLA